MSQTRSRLSTNLSASPPVHRRRSDDLGRADPAADRIFVWERGNHLFLRGRARRPGIETSRGTALVGACREIIKNRYVVHCYFARFK